MPRKLQSFPEFDSSLSDTHGDDQRVVVMKGALLSELVQQPPCIIHVFARWAVATGLLKLTKKVVHASDRLAKALKLSHRSALNPPDGSVIPSGSFSKGTRRLIATRETAIARFREGLDSVARTLGHDAAKVAQEVGLPYAWVVQGLLHGFAAGMGAVAAGQEIILPLPQISVTFDPLTERPRGYKPDQEVIERYGQWYVRNRISGVTESELAQEYHKTRHTAPHSTHTWQHDRKTIFDGINEIERLLRLTR